MSEPLRCKHDVELFDCFECFPASNTVKPPVSIWDNYFSGKGVNIEEAMERGRKLEELLEAAKQMKNASSIQNYHIDELHALVEELSK